MVIDCWPNIYSVWQKILAFFSSIKFRDEAMNGKSSCTTAADTTLKEGER